jgi:excisionase family DNA binding protein
VFDGGTDNLLSVRQVAERLGVSTAAVYKLCDRGELLHVRVLNVIRVVPEDLAAFVGARRKRGRS